MKTYKGKRTENGCVVKVDGRPLPPRNDLFNHSPDGFQWGYAGSGPAQLALAILADARGDEFAVRYHQKFKARGIAAITGDSFQMSETMIDLALQDRAGGER
jgi:hypothetical protein